MRLRPVRPSVLSVLSVLSPDGRDRPLGRRRVCAGGVAAAGRVVNALAQPWRHVGCRGRRRACPGRVRAAPTRRSAAGMELTGRGSAATAGRRHIAQPRCGRAAGRHSNEVAGRGPDTTSGSPMRRTTTVRLRADRVQLSAPAAARNLTAVEAPREDGEVAHGCPCRRAGSVETGVQAEVEASGGGGALDRVVGDREGAFEGGEHGVAGGVADLLDRDRPLQFQAE